MGVVVAVSALLASVVLVSALLLSVLLLSGAGGLPVSAAGAVTTSDGLGSADFSGVFSVVVLAASGTDAVVSSLKSLMVGGGTFAGSGRGIAASIASSAALLRAGSACASAEVADTVRKVAATAISTRSNPARFFKQSRIVSHPLGETAPAWNSFFVLSVQLQPKRRPHRFETHSVNIRFKSECAPNLFRFGTPARNDSYADDTHAP